MSARKNCLSFGNCVRTIPDPHDNRLQRIRLERCSARILPRTPLQIHRAAAPADGTPILDVGCGNGFTANYLAGKGYDVYGIDASRQGIAIANRTGNPAVSSSAT
ncbi:MAG: class I SAM-dependent methyltransferase [Alistipes sp.]